MRKSNVILRKSNREKRKLKIRSTISGTSEKPRLSVFKSTKYIYAQLIDDTAGKTLAHVSADKNVKAAFEAGKDLAKKALDKKIKTVVFDRNGYNYHGRVKSLADGAREGGLVL